MSDLLELLQSATRRGFTVSFQPADMYAVGTVERASYLRVVVTYEVLHYSRIVNISAMDNLLCTSLIEMMETLEIEWKREHED